MGDEDVERRDIEALLATRAELGRDYDADLVASFADRVEAAIAQRAAATVVERDRDRRAEERAEGGQMRQLALGIVSLGVGVPLTIVPTVAENGSLWAIAIAWLGIGAVNAAHASTVNPPRDRRPH